MGLPCSNSPKEAQWIQLDLSLLSIEDISFGNDSLLPSTNNLILWLNNAMI
jgi:hypothetical protein